MDRRICVVSAFFTFHHFTFHKYPPMILTKYSYETRSSVLLLWTAKTVPLYQSLVLLLMHDRQAYKQEISTALNDKTSRRVI